MQTASRAGTVQLPHSLFATILAAAAANRGAAESIGLLRQAGYDAGADWLQLLRQQAGEIAGEPLESLPEDRFWSRLAELWSSLGWGTLEQRQAHPGVAELVSHDWAEADAAPHGLGCQLTTGLLADLLSRIAGEDVAVLESECRSRGEDRCRFLVGSTAALEALHASLEQEGSTEDWLARTAARSARD